MTSPSAAPPATQGRWIFPLLLIFSVVFYSQRYLFGWGPADMTTYEHDMPDSIRIIKDIAWLGFLAAIFVRKFSGLDSVIAHLRRNWAFFATLAAFAAWLAFSGFLHLVRGDSASDVLLFWYRYPLEYIPMAALMPLLLDDYGRLGRLTLALALLAVLFTGLELFSGRQNSFQWSEEGPTRLGSIFGSPNDYGVFCAFLLIVLVVYAGAKWHWLLVAGLAFGLVGSVSRCAWVGFVAGLLPLLNFRRVRILFLGLVVTLAALVLLAVKTDTAGLPTQAAYILERTSGDESAYQRLDQIDQFARRFSDLEDFFTLAFGTQFFRIEDQYLAFLIRSGAIGLILFLAAMAQTLHRGWKLRQRSKLHAVGLSTVVVILTASLFVPFLDVFPTNLYFWIAVGMIWLPLEAATGREPSGAASHTAGTKA
jgi:hypothetical protein